MEAQQSLKLRACSQNNLKNFDVDLPKEAIIAVIGLSGAGKSSLVFDCIYREGQRRFLECLSPSLLQGKKHLSKPKIEIDEGISPTLAVGHESEYHDFSASLAVQTDLFDRLTLLYSKVAKQYSPKSRKQLMRQSKEQIVQSILDEYSLGAKLELFAPLQSRFETRQELLTRLQKQGFLRFYVNGEEIDSFEKLPADGNLEVLVDRLKMKEGLRSRLSDSVKTALELSLGQLKVRSDEKDRFFTEVYVCPESGIAFPPLEPADFNPRSAKGACSECRGKGTKIDLSISKEEIPLLFDCFSPKAKRHYSKLWEKFLEAKTLSDEDLVHYALHGSEESFLLKEEGLEFCWRGFLSILEAEDQSFQARFADYLIDLPCTSCEASGLKTQSRFAWIEGLSIVDFCAKSVQEAFDILEKWSSKGYCQEIFEGNFALIAEPLIDKMKNTLNLLKQVGLSYLELKRTMKTLSFGEAQRVFLASKIASKLSGVIYVLDEPSNGLHPSEVEALAYVIESLRDLGNTVFLVEHKKALIERADYILELGPSSGQEGGYICFQGSFQEFLNADTVTARCFKSSKKEPKRSLRTSSKFLKISSLNFHNIQNFSLEVPLNSLVGFCGVSGSGKSSLLIDYLATQLKTYFHKKKAPKSLAGYESIQRLLLVEQKAAGISQRSNPATYTALMTELRKLFASTKLAKARGYTASHFSLNKKGGRCELCEGLGKIPLKLGFASDLLLPCDLCQSKRFDFETLQVQWGGFNIADVLEMTAKNALKVFENHPSLKKTLQLFCDLGLGYLALGQNFDSLSKGELQRLKLIAELAKENLQKTLYILDEPSMGLHLQEQEKLITVLQTLVEKGHSVFFVEHNLDILRAADHIVELGPKAGPEGGKLVFQGPPGKIKRAKTMTAKYF